MCLHFWLSTRLVEFASHGPSSLATDKLKLSASIGNHNGESTFLDSHFPESSVRDLVILIYFYLAYFMMIITVS